LRISLNSLDGYVRDLSCAICTPEPEYERIGVKVDGEYRQLSANQLQIENEYYSPIRPKRVARSGERPTAALQRGGVEYVEIRSLDLNVFDPVGVSQNAMRFMEAFIIYCLLHDSPPIDDRSWQEIVTNHGRTAREGRHPEFQLDRDGEKVFLRDWARDILDDVATIARMIDKGEGGDAYSQAVSQQAALIEDADKTPSARVLDSMREQDSSFFEFAMNAARGHKEYFSQLEPLGSDRLAAYEAEALQSLERQAEIEQADQMGFDEYLVKYYSEQGCCD
jgi:glutamate--cysteine ligase